MNLLVIGSFASVWLLLWLIGAILIMTIYPLCRKSLFKLKPAYAGNILFGTIATPMLFSLLCTTLLFFPTIEKLFVQEHCHTNCSSHLPLLSSTGFSLIGLFLTFALLCFLLIRAWQQIRSVRKLSIQLKSLSESLGSSSVSACSKNNNKNEYRLLQTQSPLVFTIGLLRNTVYLSEGMRNACSQEELNIIFAHERAHVIRKDNLRVLAARLLTLPIPTKLATKILDDLKLLIETACDAQAAKRYGFFNVAETFIKIQRLFPKTSELPFGVSSVNGADIGQRINALMYQDKLYQPSKTLTILTSFILIALLFSFIDPLHHLIEWLSFQQ